MTRPGDGPQLVNRIPVKMNMVVAIVQVEVPNHDLTRTTRLVGVLNALYRLVHTGSVCCAAAQLERTDSRVPAHRPESQFGCRWRGLADENLLRGKCDEIW